MNIERPEGQPTSGKHMTPLEGLAIIAQPLEGEAAQITHTPDGGFTIFLRGEIQVAYRPPAADKPQSPVTDAGSPEGSKIPEKRSKRLTDAYRGDGDPSWERPKIEGEELPKNEDDKYQLVGNPYRKIGYRVTKKSKTRIADFELATHPDPKDKELTEIWRLLAFGDEADKVRDQVQKGQTDVAVTAYGPKYWERQRKRQGKLETVVIKGFTAGFVHVPKEQRPTQVAETSKPQEQQ